MTEAPQPGVQNAATPAARPGKSRLARIRERTLFGSGLALFCAGVLWLANTLGHATPILYIGAGLALLGLIEVSLMGTIFLRALPVILIVPLVGVTLLEYAFIQRPSDARPWEQLLLEFALAASLAASVHAITRGLGRFTLARQILVLALCVTVTGGFAWLDSRDLAPLDAPTLCAGFIGAAWIVALLVNSSASRRLDMLVAVGLAAWIAVPLPALAQVFRHFGVAGLISLVVLSKIGDVAGYYVGNAIGRRRPFPNLSPGKTVAGCVASFVAGLAAGGTLWSMELLPAGTIGVAGGIIAGACINIASQAGDLAESWVKRKARVKDSSSWLGPSGGILDVVDSLLFSVPAALILWPVIFGL